MIRKHLRIEYHVGKVNDADVHDKFTEPEANNEAALARAKHVIALFTLLKLVDVQSRWTDEGVVWDRLEDLSDALNGLGELGAKISDGLFGNLDMLFEAYKEANATAENASVIFDEPKPNKLTKRGRE